jgi:eukaryotic-like serine/threonine-protein kinase
MDTLPTDSPASAALPRKLGKYTLRRVLGSGATSTVYLADDPFHRREVAVKVIARGGEGSAAAAPDAGLDTEAALLGKLSHPHIVKVFDVVQHDEEQYVVMEYVGGGTIEQHCVRGQLLEFDAVIDAMFKCGKALEYMNGMGLIHRDIKPANILLTETRDIRLSDLGATLLTSEGGQIDATVGTPFYMSPEQLLGRDLEFRSDMFSLGIVFYELLSGERPFDALNAQTLIFQYLKQAPKPPSQLRPSLPAALDAIVLRMLGTLPSQRYASWQQCLDDLVRVREAARREAAGDDAGGDAVWAAGLHSTSERFQLLRQSAFFQLFSDADLWYVVEIGLFQRIREGQTLLREGDLGDHFLVLLRGRASVTKGGRLIDYVATGMSMGEISYVLEGRVPRSTTCISLSDGIVLKVNDEILRSASATCRSRFEKTFLKSIASWLVDAQHRLGTPTGS